MTEIPADPERPDSALNSIPKIVLQRARGPLLLLHYQLAQLIDSFYSQAWQSSL